MFCPLLLLVCLFWIILIEFFRVALLFICQGSLHLPVFGSAWLSYHLQFSLSIIFCKNLNTFYEKLLHYYKWIIPIKKVPYSGTLYQRRRRDLNPRAAINDLHPFQGCPFGQLGYFSESLCFFKQQYTFLSKKQAERMGFEPTVPCRITGFQDRLFKPLRHLSKHEL